MKLLHSDWRRPLLLVVLAFLAYAALQWHWMQRYHIFELPPRWDEAVYHTRAVHYFDAVREAGIQGFWSRFTDPSHPRPPLLPVSTLVFAWAGPYRVEFGHAVILFYAAVYVLGTYMIAGAMMGRRAGFFASLYLMFFPATLIYSREFLADMPAAALVCLAMFCLVRSRSFDHIGWNIALGGTLGLALDVRNFAGAYVLAPLVYSLIQGLRAGGVRRLGKLLPGVAVGVCLAAPWYVSHIDALAGFFSTYLYGEYATMHLEQEDGSFFTASGTQIPPFYYLRVLFVAASSIYFGALLVVLGLLGLRTRGSPSSRPSGGALLLWWILGSMTFLSAISNVSFNYVLPVLPALAIAIEYLAARTGTSRAVRAYAVLPVVAVGFTYWTTPAGFEICDTLRQVYPHVTRTREINPDWRIGEILREIHSREGHGGIRVGVVGSHPFFSSNAIRFEIARQRLGYDVIDCLLGRDSDVIAAIRICDYVLVKSGLQFPSASAVTLDRLDGLMRGQYMRFQQLPQKYDLPDKSRAYVFRYLPAVAITHTDDRQPYPGTRAYGSQGRLIKGRVMNPVSVVFDAQIELLGVHLHRRYSAWYARYFWHALSQPLQKHMSFVHFISGADEIFMQDDHWLGGEPSTVEWQAGDFVTEGRSLEDLDGTGRIAAVGIGILTPDRDANTMRVDHSSVACDWPGRRARIPSVDLGVDVPHELRSGSGTEYVEDEVSYGDVLALKSCVVNQEGEHAPTVRYVWRCIGKMTRDYEVYVHFTSRDGTILFQNDHRIMEGGIPTTDLRPGEWAMEDYLLPSPPVANLRELDIRIGIQEIRRPSKSLQIVSQDTVTDWGGVRAILRPRR